MPKEITRRRPAARHSRTDALEPANSLLVHDIKNLSFRLGALLQNLEVNYEDPLFKKSVVEILADTVSRMNSIVRRCRDRQGELIVKVPVDLNDVLNGLVEALPRRREGGAPLLIEERYARLPKIWGDVEFLREAFSILIQNALEAMDGAGGRLTLSTGFRSSKSGVRQILVSVTDTGCGMSSEHVRKHLFAPFVTTKEQGLGLGLYACRKIVALHDGAIRVRSRLGRGTTFRIVFRAG